MTTVDEVPDDESDAGPELDSQGECTHRRIYADPVQACIRRCRCAHVRYTTCRLCNAVINLSGTEIAWPHACCRCQRPVCVACANEMRRDDDSPALVVCPRCDASSSPAQVWSVVYRITLWDREKRRHNKIRPHPCIFATRDDAARGALAYLGTLVPGTLYQDAADELAQRMKLQYNGWFGAEDKRNGYEILKVEVGLFALHRPGVELFELPRVELDR